MNILEFMKMISRNVLGILVPVICKGLDVVLPSGLSLLVISQNSCPNYSPVHDLSHKPILEHSNMLSPETLHFWSWHFKFGISKLVYSCHECCSILYNTCLLQFNLSMKISVCPILPNPTNLNVIWVLLSLILPTSANFVANIKPI